MCLGPPQQRPAASPGADDSAQQEKEENAVVEAAWGSRRADSAFQVLLETPRTFEMAAQQDWAEAKVRRLTCIDTVATTTALTHCPASFTSSSDTSAMMRNDALYSSCWNVVTQSCMLGFATML